jgi:hypothetical protein
VEGVGAGAGLATGAGGSAAALEAKKAEAIIKPTQSFFTATVTPA